MEFTIKQNVLKEELSYIQGVVERKSTIPILSNILIESLGENEIRILGTDLDVTIRCDAEAEIKQGGSMCIQARKLPPRRCQSGAIPGASYFQVGSFEALQRNI